MRFWIALGAVVALLGFGWVYADSQGSKRVTLEFSEENPDSLRAEETFGEEDVDARDEARSERDRDRKRSRSGDIVRFGNDIVIDEDEVINGDVVSVGGDVRVYGMVRGDVASVGGDVYIESTGEVIGQAVSLGGQVEQLGGGSISGSSVALPDIPAVAFTNRARPFQRWGTIFERLLMVGLTLLVGYGLVKLAPDRTRITRTYVEQRPGAAFLWGLLAAISLAPSAVAVALIVVLLCITLIGIPVAILVVFGYAIGLLALGVFGYLIGATALGRFVLSRFRPQDPSPDEWKSLWVGVAVVGGSWVFAALINASWMLGSIAGDLSGFVGFLSHFLWFLVTLFGVGAILATRAGQSVSRPPLPGMGGPPPAPQPSPTPPTPPAPPAVPSPTSAPSGPPTGPPPAPSSPPPPGSAVQSSTSATGSPSPGAPPPASPGGDKPS